MALVVLIIHLLVCVCLIGLVLLQRSEGGALGMGGGNSGALMSGRGAADALARMTMVAGGFFLVTSFGLTILSGSASSLSTRSVFDSLPTQRTAPAPGPAQPTAPAPAQSTPARPDPTQSSAPQAADHQLASAITPGPTPAAASPLAPSANDSTARAAPITTHPPVAAPRNNTATTVPASTNATSAATSRPPPAAASTRTNPPPATTTAARSTNATTAGNNANTAGRLVLPNTSGSVGGIALTDDPPINPESNDNGVQAVRRERAGPDQ